MERKALMERFTSDPRVLAEPALRYNSLLEASGMTFKVVLEPTEEGGYTVFVPALPSCISESDTIEEALQNIREAIALR